MSSEMEATGMPAITDEPEVESEVVDLEATTEIVPDDAIGSESPTFLRVWEDQNEGETDEIVRLYRESEMPPIQVFSQLKGDVHYRRDIHPVALCKTEAGCGNWNPGKRHVKPKVIRPLRTQLLSDTTESAPVETSDDESEPNGEDTAPESD